MTDVSRFRASLLAGAAVVFLTPQAFAASFNITSGTDTTAKTVKGGDTGTVASGASLSTSAAAIAWDLSGSAAPAVINNSGTISGVARGIDGNTGTAVSAQSFTLNNLTASSVLTSTADAFRINKDILGGVVVINNAGTIQSTGAQQALDFAAITSAATVNITNKLAAFIQSSGQSAIELGGGTFAITNDGTIQTTAAGQRGINYKPANLSNLASYTLTNGSATNSAALISSTDDTVRISATGLTGANLTAVYNVAVDNYGTIKSNAAGSGQAIDFNDLVSRNGAVTITNRVGGLIQAADADGIRGGVNTTINNSGTIRSNFLTGANGNASGNDAIDFQSNTSGVVNNFAGGDISGAKNGITAKYGPTIFNAGTITGRDGSGINIDTSLDASPANGPIANTGITTIVNTGTIIGTAVSNDGDAIDVDYLLNLTNSGTIKAVGIDPVTAASLNEALAIGGGTVINKAGGLIISDERAITVDDSDHGNAFGAVTIDNAGTITGSNGQAIAITSISDNTLTNRTNAIINGSVVMGNGTDTINLYAGSALIGAINGGGGTDTIHLLGSGSGTLTNVSNVEVLKIVAGQWAVDGNQSYSAGVSVAAGATVLVNGNLGGNVTNNGTVRVDNATVSFTGTFQNNGAYISDPSTQTFNNLSVGTNGYIQAGVGDVFKVASNFANASAQNQLWYTQEAALELIGTDQTNHWIDVLGADQGKTARNQDFSWGELNIDSGNLVTFQNVTAFGDRGWYVSDLIGALISGSSVTNITGFNGLTVYYDAYQSDNAYLGGLTYTLKGGGKLLADVTEPMTWIMFLSGIALLGGMLRRRTIAGQAES